LGAAACALATALALSSCGAGSSVSSAIDPVAQAAEISELAPGFKVSYREQVRAPGSPVVSMSGSEDVEHEGQRASLSVRAKVDGKTFTTLAQYAGGAIYMQVPGASGSSITHGRKWMEYDINDLDAVLGISLSSLSAGETPSDPSKQLSYLRAAGTVTRIGSQQVQGVPTTHYRATLEWARYPEKVAPSQRAAARASVAAVERLTGASSQTVDVWIDARHRVRREEFTMQECLSGVSGKAQLRTTMEYFDFGPQAIPKLPPSREVAALTGYILKQLKHTKFGCS
jgi:hypothetical protein